MSLTTELEPEKQSIADVPDERPAVELVIRPSRGWIAVDWRELYRYRELLYFLVWRDVKVRYKQTVLGVAWAILVPVISMVIFTLIFNGVAGMGERLPAGMGEFYAVWLFAGLVPWLMFQTAMSDGGLSLVNQRQLLTKIYLPRLFVPAATVGRACVDMALAWLVFIGLLLYYQPAVAWTAVLVLPLILVTALASLGVAYTLSAMSVTYRDFRFMIPFMGQIWMWASFVVIPLEAVAKDLADSDRYGPGWVSALYYVGGLNPMLGLAQGFRSAIFADMPWQPLNLAISTVSALALFVFGLFFFRKTERRFADIA